MSKLSMINEYYINADNIAYLAIWSDGTKSIGTEVVFNTFAAAANESLSAFEPLRLYVTGKTPTEVADFLNNEPRF